MISDLLSSPEYSDFAGEAFDADEYANRIIQLKAGKAWQNLDIPSSLAKMSFCIDHLNKQMHEQVGSHYEDLLEQVSGLQHLEDALQRVKDGVKSTNSSFNRVNSKVKEAYQTIQNHIEQLQLVQAIAEIMRRIHRLLQLNNRLESQVLEGDAGLAKAAITIHEIETLLAESDLNGINIVEIELKKYHISKDKVIVKAESQLVKGMGAQNQADIATGIQVFYNLGTMVPKVHEIVDRLAGNITKQVQTALDVNVFLKEIKDTSNQSAKKSNEPSKNMYSYSGELWKRLECLMDVMYENATQLNILERVLSRKRDPMTYISYLDEVKKDLDGNMQTYFWKLISSCIEREIRQSTKSSVQFNQVFQMGYPKLLRLFNDFFSRLSVITTTSASASINSKSDIITFDSSILLKSISSFETIYIRESLSRLLDPVNLSFPDKPLVGLRPMPLRDDVDRILRTISRELDIAKFNPVLLKAVTKNVSKAINMYVVRSEQIVATDSSVYVFSGASIASSSQLLNIEIVNCLWSLADGIWKIPDEFNDDAVTDILEDSVKGIHKLIQSIVGTLITHLVQELESTILNIHTEDFGRNVNSKAPRGVNSNESSISRCILDIGSILRWSLREIMSKFQCGDDTKEWIRTVGVRILLFFLRQASLIRPIGSETGKLKLTSDMTQLEFSLNQWLTGTGLKLEAAMGDAYKALRSFRQLLFLDLNQVQAAHHTAALPPIIVAHHLISRAYPLIPFPMVAFNWTEAQYSEWLDTHTDQEAAGLLIRCLDQYADDVRKRGDKEFRVEFPIIRSYLDKMLK